MHICTVFAQVRRFPMADEIYAVLIADVMASSARKNMRTQLGKKLAAASERHLKQKLIRFPYTVTAGDEFQTITAQLSSVPALLLDLRASLWPLPLRIGVGIGQVADRLQPPVNRLTGPAFQFARWGIDNVKASGLFKFDVLTAFASANEHFDQTINLLYGLHDTLVSQVTAKQWETIRQFLSWLTNTELFSPELYFLSRLPAEVDFGETAAVVIMALTLSFLATLYPSWRAARLDPVDALRYE